MSIRTSLVKFQFPTSLYLFRKKAPPWPQIIVLLEVIMEKEILNKVDWTQDGKESSEDTMLSGEALTLPGLPLFPK